MTDVPKWLEERFNPDYPSWANVKKNPHTGGDIVNGCHMPSLKVKTLSKGTATVYSFSFEETFSWAIFTINDATGEFHVQSDWGNWQHRWNISSLGERYQGEDASPLTRFLAIGNDPRYVTDKLHYDCGDKSDQFSEDETKNYIRKEIVEARREDRLTKDRARLLWEQLDDNIDWSSAESFVSSLEGSYCYSCDELQEFLSEPHYEYVQTEPTFGFTLLQHVLLPFFFKYLRCEVVQVEEKDEVA